MTSINSIYLFKYGLFKFFQVIDRAAYVSHNLDFQRIFYFLKYRLSVDLQTIKGNL